ncbi:MAG: hypothetical protein VBE63_06640 [Lamprobacter sp.]|uniref:hypothetical protein n=1 Tax=Lamprobacter sp. TaxID=3100796 RepID=UPI002B25907B|nr:hypothetical protein [Lamprobacter sp.]MEA3639605.1 hypothetical protein [Lamprobacter sp.]
MLTVQHVDTTAVVGEYSLSVGEPLPPGGGSSSSDRVFLGRCDCGIPNDFAPDGRRLSDIIQNRLAGYLEQPDKHLRETVRRLGVELWQEGLLDQQGVSALVSCAVDYALGRCSLIN